MCSCETTLIREIPTISTTILLPNLCEFVAVNVEIVETGEQWRMLSHYHNYHIVHFVLYL